jgi:hypothetical protein
LEKMCGLRRGVRWRLTYARKCVAIMVIKKKISAGHIWTTLYPEVLSSWTFRPPNMRHQELITKQCSILSKKGNIT